MFPFIVAIISMWVAISALGSELTAAPIPPTSHMTHSNEDPFQWLEEVEGEKALEWVNAQNSRSLALLQGDPRYPTFQAEALKILNASDRIAIPVFRGGSLDNFWQDQIHVRGLWRRTTLESYRNAEPQWVTLLDVDALATAEHANWVYKGVQSLPPTDRLCLLLLSDGGKDAVEMREFDAESRSFVEGGFRLPAGKQEAVWVDVDTLLVAREWLPGEKTESGYPYIIKRWTRGQALDQAQEIFRGKKSDVSVSPNVIRDSDGQLVAELIVRAIGFFESEFYVLTKNGQVRLPVPTQSSFRAYLNGQAVFTLEEDWSPRPGETYPQGAVVGFDLAATLADPHAIQPKVIFAPGPRQSVQGVSSTRSRLILTVSTNVVSQVVIYQYEDGNWTSQTSELPINAALAVITASEWDDTFFVIATSFLTPTTLWLADARKGASEKLKSLPARFDATALVTEQFEATSKDGTRIPYFVTRPKELKFDGEGATLLYGYGGFQVSLTPTYSGNIGKLWLESGGVYVLANIRGGGEFGPAWHQAGLKTKRQVVYDDFTAVAQDLITRKITRPRRLGIQGGSNGGLLMGVELTQQPDLWNAVVVQVPLLDMLRYHTLLAGASWMAEYGDPADPVEGAFLRGISPYHNLHAGVTYPEPFFVTSTKDDRVHPAHARKMAAKMERMGLPFLYYENTDGGHAAAANLQETAKRVSLELIYLTRKLKD